MTPIELIEGFRKEYKELTGREIIVREKVLMEKMPLEKLHRITQETFGIDPMQTGSGETGRMTREIRFLIPRYVMYRVALDMGYQQQEIGMYAHVDQTAVGWTTRSKIIRYPEYIGALEQLRTAITQQ